MSLIKTSVYDLAKAGAELEIESIFYSHLAQQQAVPVVQIIHPFLCRCRPNYDGEVFRHIKQLSYPPDPAKIEEQRCNYKGQQLLYGALPTDSEPGHCQHTALLETAWEHIEEFNTTRQYLTLSRWKINRPLNVCMLSFSPKSCDLNGDFRRAKQKYNRILERKYGQQWQSKTEFLEYISEIFCQRHDKENCYRISAAFFNALRRYLHDRGEPFDGLVYPSANTGAAGMNVALVKEVVDTGSVTMDWVAMTVMQRNPANPKDIFFPPVSDIQAPDENGCFRFKYIA